MTFKETLRQSRNSPAVYLHDFLLNRKRDQKTEHLFAPQNLNLVRLRLPKSQKLHTYRVKDKAHLHKIMRLISSHMTSTEQVYLAREKGESLLGNPRKIRVLEAEDIQFDPLKTEDAWRKANARRHRLIDLKYSAGLSHALELELEQLQQATAEYIDRKNPMPFDILSQMEAELNKD